MSTDAFACPSCDKKLRLAKMPDPGQRIRCPECENVFAPVVKQPPAVVRRPAAAAEREESAPRRDPASIRRDSAVTRNGAEAPRRAPAAGIKPANGKSAPVKALSSSSNRKRDDDSDEDRPARRSSKSSGTSPVLLFGLLGGAAFLFLLCGGGGLGAYFMLRSKPTTTAVASGDSSSGNAIRDKRADPVPAPVLPVVAAPPPVQQAPPPGEPGNGSLSKDVLDRVKNATVYIRVTGVDKSKSSGSGFFEASSHKVLTNAHVLDMLKPGSPRPLKVEVIRNGGLPTEVTYQARILAVDTTSDLAVLEAAMPPGEEANIPTLTIGLARNLVETQRVFVFGYPLGEQVSKKVTVAETSVSNLHTTPDGMVKQVQVNGGMHHGNSGGPVVDTSGNVVGVAVAGIEGTQINFAIPGEYVSSVFNGRISGSSVNSELVSRNGKFYANVRLQTIDPLNRIQKISIDYWIGNADAKGIGPSTVQPVLGPDASPRRTVLSTYNNQVATAEMELDFLPGVGKIVHIQPVITNGTGQQAWVSSTTFVPLTPIDPKPIRLVYAPKNGAQPLQLKSTGNYQLSAPGESLTYAIHLDAKFRETTTIRGPIAEQVLTMEHFATGVSLDGKPVDTTDEYKQAVTKDVRNLQIILNSDSTGKLTNKRSDVSRVPPASRKILEKLGEQMQHSLEAATVPLPPGGADIQPNQSWQATCQLPVDLPGEERSPGTLNITYTYLGVRQHGGRVVAVFNLVGVLGNGVTGQLRGQAMLDVATGVVIRANAKADATTKHTSVMTVGTGRTARRVVSTYQVKGTLETTLTREGDFVAGAPTPVITPAPVVITPPVVPPVITINPPPAGPVVKGAETLILGGGFDPQFKESAPEGGLLIGLEIGLDKAGAADVVRAFRAIYQNDKNEEVKGKQYGTNVTRVMTIKAKPGYAVGAIVGKAGLTMDGMQIIFMRATPDGKLDPSDTYSSDWVGGMGGGPKTRLAGDGTPVIGLIGKANAKDATGLGLLLKQK